MRKFLDTNIILRHLLADHPQHSPKAKKFLKLIEEGREKAITTPLVIAEVVYVLESISERSRDDIKKAILQIIRLRNISLQNKSDFEEIFEIYQKKKIDFIDAYNVVFAKRKMIKEIVSFDKHFDRVESLKRFEP